MSLKVVFRPEAESDLLEAHDWYEEQQIGIGGVFSSAVERTITRIETMQKCARSCYETYDAQRCKRSLILFTIVYSLIESK